MNAHENFKLKSTARLCEIYSKLNIIFDLLIEKEIISQDDVSKKMGKINEQECRSFIEDLFSDLD